MSVAMATSKMIITNFFLNCLSLYHTDASDAVSSESGQYRVLEKFLKCFFLSNAMATSNEHNDEIKILFCSIS